MPVQKVLTSKDQTVPVKVWTNNIDAASEGQLRMIAALPFVYKHIAAMPDVHLGKGATVGSVIATKGAVVPSAVGVDIGCGMMAAKMPFSADRLGDNLNSLFDSLSAAIPVGQAQHNSPVRSSTDWGGWSGFYNLPESVQKDRFDKAMNQLGTMGGGNHFIEVCLDLDNNVWIMLHSGSRGIGNLIGNHYIDRAKDLMRSYMIKLEDPALGYLPEGTDLFNAYWKDLQWAQSYAMKNREIMMNLALRSVAEVIFGDKRTVVTPLMTVNCHHNYAERENHYGHNVIVTRKGAVRARVGDMGIIPGSMGTRSYIVEGLGVEESFCSCSHGAGRMLSRGAAKKKYTEADIEEQTAGVICRKDLGIVDELPGAYKDIDAVMEDQKDLVRVVAQLKQVLCIKG